MAVSCDGWVLLLYLSLHCSIFCTDWLISMDLDIKGNTKNRIQIRRWERHRKAVYLNLKFSYPDSARPNVNTMYPNVHPLPFRILGVWYQGNHYCLTDRASPLTLLYQPSASTLMYLLMASHSLSADNSQPLVLSQEGASGCIVLFNGFFFFFSSSLDLCSSEGLFRSLRGLWCIAILCLCV